MKQLTFLFLILMGLQTASAQTAEGCTVTSVFVVDIVGNCVGTQDGNDVSALPFAVISTGLSQRQLVVLSRSSVPASAECTVLDASGKKLIVRSLTAADWSNNKLTLDVQNLPAGAYFIEIRPKGKKAISATLPFTLI
jgi:hypothetical protein